MYKVFFYCLFIFILKVQVFGQNKIDCETFKDTIIRKSKCFVSKCDKSKIYKSTYLNKTFEIISYGNYYGLINTKNHKLEIPIIFEYIYPVLVKKNCVVLKDESSYFYYDLNKKRASLCNFEVYSNTSNSFIIFKNSGYGIIDSTGKTRIEAKYDRIVNLNNGYCELISKSLKGIFDLNRGKLIFDSKYYEIQYDYENKVFFCHKDSYTELFDFDGNILVNIPKCEIFSFSKSIFLIKRDSLFGLIDNSGKIVLPIKYQSIEKYNTKILAKENESYIIIDKSFKDSIKFKTTELTVLDKFNYFWVKLNNNYKFYSIDSKLDTISLKSFKFVDKTSSMFSDLTIVSNGLKYGLYSFKINNETSFEYDTLYNNFSDRRFDSYFICKKNNKYGLIDYNFKLLKNCIFDYIELYKDEYLVSQNNKEAIYSYQNYEKIPFVYEKISKYNDALLIGANENFFGLYDLKRQKTILDPIYDYIYITNSQNGFVAIRNQEIFNGTFDKITKTYKIVSQSICKFKQNTSKQVEASPQTTEMLGSMDFVRNNIPYSYDIYNSSCDSTEHFAFEIKSKILRIEKSGKFGLINLVTGKLVLPIFYDEILNVPYSDNFLILHKEENYQIYDSKSAKIINESYSFFKPVFDWKYIIVKNKFGFGLLNSHFKTILNPSYLEIEELPISFSDKNDEFKLKRFDNKSGIYKVSENKMILPFGNDQFQFRNGCNFIILNNNSHNRIFSKHSSAPFGNYSSIEVLNNGIYCYKEGKQGLLNIDGKESVPCIYEKIKYLEYGHYLVMDSNNKFGVIDINNNIIIPLEFDRYILNDNFIIFQKEREYHIYETNSKSISFNNKILADNVYSGNFSGQLIYKLKSGFSIYNISDTTSKNSINQYDTISTFRYLDAHRVTKYSKFGIIDNNGRIIKECIYDKIEFFNNNKVLYKYNNLVQIEDRDQNIIVPYLFNDISYVNYEIAIGELNKKMSLYSIKFNKYLNNLNFDIIYPANNYNEFVGWKSEKVFKLVIDKNHHVSISGL